MASRSILRDDRGRGAGVDNRIGIRLHASAAGHDIDDHELLAVVRHLRQLAGSVFGALTKDARAVTVLLAVRGPDGRRRGDLPGAGPVLQGADLPATRRRAL